ncbi:unnamed protein product [Sphenostylis stenocarpa]|uniref:Uncharacterized protein n=1 Tax=Sphenostylis stenocarpa TaxID=92480 RepID=A0AA86ST30_9FABA|nr:unnamed protein product [Sphenostylis stenocarpa]
MEESDPSLYALTNSGSIPIQLGNLTQLQTLFLYDNSLTGSIPSTLGQMKNLRYLFLYSNELDGNWKANNSNNIDSLILYSNELEGNIPTELGNLTKLRQLYLSWNLLTTSIPPTFGRLEKTDIPSTKNIHHQVVVKVFHYIRQIL